MIKKALIIIITLFAFSCKKDKPANSNTNSPDIFNYNSFLNIKETYTINNGNITLVSRIAEAEFNKASINCSRWCTPEFFKIDSVLFNNKLLPENDMPYVMNYSDSIPLSPFPPFVWNIRGSSEYPSFKDTITDSIPKFTAYNTVPDSFSQSGSTQIILSSINADTISILIGDSQSSGYWGQNLPAASTSVTVTHPNFLTLTRTGKIYFTCYKKYFKMVGSKRINYTIESIYTKTISIVP